MAVPTGPVDIVNRALDACGLEAIGDLGEGTKAARAALRVYDPTLRQLLSAAHWNFARKQFALARLGDDNTPLPRGWSYMYEWPTDCVHFRHVLVSGIMCAQPAPFVVTNLDWPVDLASEWWLVEGHDPESVRVILTNQAGAVGVYTGLMQYPDAWDPLFEEAMVAALAAKIAMPCISDKALARQVRQENTLIARAALDAALVRDGNEGWTVHDWVPDWLAVRTGGAPWYPGVY